MRIGTCLPLTAVCIACLLAACATPISPPPVATATVPAPPPAPEAPADVPAYELAGLLGGPVMLKVAAIQPGGTQLALATDTSLGLLDTASGRYLPLESDSGSINDLTWSADGVLLASAGADGVIRLWAGVNGQSAGLLEVDAAGVVCAALTPTGALIAVGLPGGDLQIWDVAAGTVILALPADGAGGLIDLAWSPDGIRLALSRTGAAGIDVRDPATGEQMRLAADDAARDLGSLAWSPDGSRLTALDGNGRLWIWDTAEGSALPEALVPPLASLAWSLNSSRLAAGGAAGGLYVWEALGGEPTTNHPTGPDAVVMLAWAGDDRLIAADRAGDIWIYPAP